MFWNKRPANRQRTQTQEIAAAEANVPDTKRTTREIAIQRMYEHLYRRQQLIEVEEQARRDW